MDTTPFFLLLFVHLGGLILGFGSVMVTDLYGLLWIRDRVRFRQVTHLSGITEKFIWTGWGLMVASGIPMLWLKGEVDNLLVVKLFFVALIGLNGWFLRALHRRVRGYAEGDDVPALVLFRLTLALGVSQLAWWAALSIGFLHRHVQTVIAWPPSPALLLVAVVAALLLAWGGGEALIRRNRPAAEDVKQKITPP